MPMIALSAFVIETEYAFASVNQHEPVFEMVLGWPNRSGGSPDSHFNNRFVGAVALGTKYEFRFH